MVYIPYTNNDSTHTIVALRQATMRCTRLSSKCCPLYLEINEGAREGVDVGADVRRQIGVRRTGKAARY